MAQQDLKKSGLSKNKIASIAYRPFDNRYTYYTGNSRGFHCMPRREVMNHMLLNKNLGIQLCRQIVSDAWRHILVSNLITDDCHVSNKTRERGYVFPLYIYPNPNNIKELEENLRPNLSLDFLKDITSKLAYTPTPEAIFYYIYAIFHSPTYRARYAEFLKIDFPRVPLTSNNELFCQLAEYGEELVALHLMKSPKLDKHITKFVESKGNRAVDAGHPKYSNGAVTGYQVCQKWLKDRKGRRLSDEDVKHYQRIVVALKETIALMKKIDEAIPGFPIQ